MFALETVHLMNKSTNNQLTIIAFFLGFCFLLITTWSQLSFDSTTPFFCAGLGLINIVSFATFLIYGLLKRQIPQSFYPVLATLVFFVLSYWVDSQNLWHLGFYLRLADFNTVIALAQDDQIRPNEYGSAELPNTYHHLSDGGAINIRGQEGIVNILFYRRRGILGEYSGYMYRSGNGTPEFKDGCDFAIKQLEPHWFLCVSN